MLIDLIRDEILSNPDWSKYKRFTIGCSKLFKYRLFSEIVNGYMTINVVKDTMFGNKTEALDKYTKYMSPEDILFEFEITLKSGYNITPKPYDDAPTH